MSSPLIELDHVSKRYPNGFVALENVSLSLFPGEIHALLGENGAGKSTLMNILYGVHEPSAGGVLMGGRQVIHRRPADAIANGIGMVHQHFKLVAPFSVAENLALVARGAQRKTLRRHAGVAISCSVMAWISTPTRLWVIYRWHYSSGWKSLRRW